MTTCYSWQIEIASQLRSVNEKNVIDSEDKDKWISYFNGRAKRSLKENCYLYAEKTDTKKDPEAM